MSAERTDPRFFRPADVARLRRNQRKIQLHRLLTGLRTLLVLAIVVSGLAWVWRHTRSDQRFAVRRIDVAGAVHTPRPAIDLVTRRYQGANLFQIDIARVQRDLGALGWVRRIDIEKTLPDTLGIKITERQPVALLQSGERLLYVDEEGAGFAALSPSIGNDELPLITDAHGGELRRTVRFLESLRRADPAMYARVSEVRPIPPRGFAVFDRQLRAVVFANGDDAVAKWRQLYAILESEGRPDIEYADLRFADRIIVKKQLAAVSSQLSGANGSLRAES